MSLDVAKKCIEANDVRLTRAVVATSPYEAQKLYTDREKVPVLAELEARWTDRLDKPSPVQGG